MYIDTWKFLLHLLSDEAIREQVKELLRKQEEKRKRRAASAMSGSTSSTSSVLNPLEERRKRKTVGREKILEIETSVNVSDQSSRGVSSFFVVVQVQQYI